MNENSSAQGYVIYFPKSAKATTVTAVAIFDKSHQSIVYTADRYTGEMIKKTGYSAKNNVERFEDLNYDIHLGLILGVPGKIIVFIASLLSASLPVTGFFIWYYRKNKNKRVPSL